MPSTTFTYTGSEQTFVVPAGITTLTIECWGAQGAQADANLGGALGGKGGYVKGNVSVTPGETLRVYVGQRPPRSSETFRPGGWNGGGAGGPYPSGGPGGEPLTYGGSGGGATDVRRGGTGLEHRIAIAAGGGGASVYGGGEGGAATGQHGFPGNSLLGGRGGTSTAGGAGGIGDWSNGTDGSLGQGGDGSFSGSSFGSGGGGGGGGFYGGGGGGGNESFDGGGGGGGGNRAGLMTTTTSTRGVRTGNGLATITWGNPPLAPTDVRPTSGEVVGRDNPTLHATMPVHPDGSGIAQKVEWQLATNSGFTANVRTVTQADSALKSSGAQSMVTPSDQELFQTTWFIRARVIDQGGNIGPYSAAHSFTVTHPPSTTLHSPTGDTTVVYAATTALNWQFTDPSMSDYQTAYEIEVARADTGTVVLSTGVVAGDSQSHAAAIPAAQKDQPLRWRVKVRDRDQVWSGWSSWHLFRVSDRPVVAITSPVGQIDTATPLTEWTFTASGGRTQASRRVVFKDSDGFSIHDTGWVTSPLHSYQVQNPIFENESSYTVEVTVTDNRGLVSTTQTAAFNTDWSFVESPLFQINDLYESAGYVNISWDDTRHDDDFFYYRVYRRVVGTEDWELLVERNDQPGYYEVHDWLADSGVSYEYAVTQAANRFGSVIESDRFAVAVTPTSTHYWLIHPTLEELNLRIDRVTDEKFDEEYEQESVHVLGRGRHTDYGDRLGFTGTITAQFRDYENGVTAREQRKMLEMMKVRREAVYLRNPFGDVWLVAVGDLGISRVSGVGRREFFDATIPYEEVG
jgi:hypothetical protein